MAYRASWHARQILQGRLADAEADLSHGLAWAADAANRISNAKPGAHFGLSDRLTLISRAYADAAVTAARVYSLTLALDLLKDTDAEDPHPPGSD